MWVPAFGIPYETAGDWLQMAGLLSETPKAPRLAEGPSDAMSRVIVHAAEVDSVAG
jgi:hypothetical protein